MKSKKNQGISVFITTKRHLKNVSIGVKVLNTLMPITHQILETHHVTEAL